MPADAATPLLTRAQVQSILSVHETTLDRWIRAKVLPSVKVGTRRYVPREAIDRLIAAALAKAAE